MLLCRACHKNCTCIAMPVSYGECEKCGTSDACANCVTHKHERRNDKTSVPAARNNDGTQLILTEFEAGAAEGVHLEMKTKSSHGRWVQPGGIKSIVAIPKEDIPWLVEHLQRYLASKAATASSERGVPDDFAVGDEVQLLPGWREVPLALAHTKGKIVKLYRKRADVDIYAERMPGGGPSIRRIPKDQLKLVSK